MLTPPVRRFIGILSAFVGLACIASSFTDSWWKPLLHPLVFDHQGNYQPQSFTSSLARFLFRQLSDWMTMRSLGGLLTIGGIVLVLHQRFSWSRNLPTVISLTVGVLLTGMTILATAPLFMVEPGTEIRPMGWSFTVFVLSAAGVLGAVTVGLLACARDQPRSPAVAGLLLCLAPFPTAMILSMIAQGLLGWRLAP